MYVVINTNNNHIAFPHILDSKVIDTSPFVDQDDANGFRDECNRIADEIGVGSPFVVMALGDLLERE